MISIVVALLLAFTGLLAFASALSVCLFLLGRLALIATGLLSAVLR